MAKKGGSQTVTQKLDPEMQAQIRKLFGYADVAGNSAAPGLSQPTQDAIGGYGQAMKAGNLGFGALSGDPNAMQSFMNPFQQNVIDSTMGDFSHLRDQTLGSVNDQATRAGAFGGSRHGVAEGVALGELGRGEQSTLANLRNQGFESAMGRAGGMASMGMSAANGLAGLGEYSRNVQMESDPAMRRFLMQQQAVGSAPYGQSTSTPYSKNPGAGLLGGAASGASIGSNFGPWGTGIGAGLGGLIGLFG